MKKLTQAVFDLPECPPDARSAAVDSDGEAWVFLCDKSKLKIEDAFGSSGHYPSVLTREVRFIGEGYDTTNWQQSAIDRGEK